MGLLDKFFGKPKAGADGSGDIGDMPQFTAVSSVKVTLPNGAQVHQDAMDRKAWAEGLLQGEAVPINPYLPFVESEAKTRIRPLDEVIKRFHCLSVVAERGCGLSDDVVRDMITSLSLDDHFTMDEIAFLDDPAPDEQARTNMSWRNEAAWVLAWALGYFPDLGRPDKICDMDLLSEAVMDMHPEKNGLRSTNDILNMADLIYRYHWAIRQAQLDGQPVPAGLSHSVVMERHHALNWLIHYCDSDWDDVTTDT